MRKLKRSIARTAMETSGVWHINKKKAWKHNDGEKPEMLNRSYFSIYWRKYLDAYLAGGDKKK